jgi:hypothetical protein
VLVVLEVHANLVLMVVLVVVLEVAVSHGTPLGLPRC